MSTEPHEKILILGGTKEAAGLAAQLVEAGCNVTTSLAGRTKEPTPVAGEVRTGGFGGVQGLAQYIAQNAITRLIDATHPFAEQISKNAVQAAAISGVKFEIRQRAPWEQKEGDEWIEVHSLTEAANAIPSGATVLLALGSQYIDQIANRSDVKFIIRMVDAPKTPLAFADHKLILGRPSADWQTEAALLKRENITHILCRNSGGTGAYAKIEAARQLNLPVIMVQKTESGL